LWIGGSSDLFVKGLEVIDYMADSKKNPDRKTVDFYRDAITGQRVTEAYADKHPKTTEHERYKKK